MKQTHRITLLAVLILIPSIIAFSILYLILKLKK
jgi:hypothetical protein